MIKDYEIAYGMKAGEDYETVAVVHSGSGALLLEDDGYNGSGAPASGRNKFQSLVESLMDKGVKFYFCQKTTRGMITKNVLPATKDTTGGTTAELLDSVQYVGEVYKFSTYRISLRFSGTAAGVRPIFTLIFNPKRLISGLKIVRQNKISAFFATILLL